MKMRFPIFLLLIAMLALQLGADAAKTVKISIKGGFNPDAVTIQVGDSVTWSNDDDSDHHVLAADNSFDSGNLKAGDSFTFKFTSPGTFAYSCALHPREKGTITVEK